MSQDIEAGMMQDSEEGISRGAAESRFFVAAKKSYHVVEHTEPEVSSQAGGGG